MQTSMNLRVRRVRAAMRVGASAMRIIFVHDAAQFLRMRERDFLVAAFPDHDGRMVAVINNQVPERRGANFPGGANRVGFAVHARLLDHDAQAVASFDLVPGRRRNAPSAPNSRPPPSSDSSV